MSLVHDLATLTIQDAIRGLDIRAFSTVELVAATLARIEVTEPAIHAYVTVLEQQAREEAIAADRLRATERRTRPLLGIPLGVKDLFDVVGTQTLCNAPQRRNVPVATVDAPAVASLRRDGGIVVGKTVTQEYAAGVVSDPARNPWDTDRVPGGSSGGSAAAVAIGSALGALGSDTGGSIRTPAAVTGTVGLKPTYGRLSAKGVYPLAPGLDTVGPIARSVADAVILYLSLADRPAEIDRVPELLAPFGPEGLEGVRIGVLGGFFAENVQPDVLASFAEAVGVLRQLDAEIVETTWDEAAHARGIGALLNRIESGAIHYDHLRVEADLLRPDPRGRFEAGELLPAITYLRARRAREVARDRIATLFRDQRLDLVVAPTVAATAPRADDLRVEFPDGIEGIGTALTRFTMPWNATGQPVISVPSGADRDGMPIGIAFVGRPDDELGISRVAAQYERATQWFQTNASVSVE